MYLYITALSLVSELVDLNILFIFMASVVLFFLQFMLPKKQVFTKEP